ncbi:MAG: hypothetical protein QXP36_00260 [Conexivisphaerales archaeon]
MRYRQKIKEWAIESKYQRVRRRLKRLANKQLRRQLKAETQREINNYRGG